MSNAFIVNTVHRHNIIRGTLCAEVDVFKGKVVTLSTNFRWKGTSPINLCWYQKTFMWYQNIGSMFFRFVTKHACDRQTNGEIGGQNYGPRYRTNIAASRGKKGILKWSYVMYIDCLRDSWHAVCFEGQKLNIEVTR